MTLIDLKKALKDRGAKVTGRKKDLVERYGAMIYGDVIYIYYII